MNVYVVTQGEGSENTVVCGVFQHMADAKECAHAGQQVALRRHITVYGVETRYNPRDDYFLINEIEESVQ